MIIVQLKRLQKSLMEQTTGNKRQVREKNKNQMLHNIDTTSKHELYCKQFVIPVLPAVSTTTSKAHHNIHSEVGKLYARWNTHWQQ